MAYDSLYVAEAVERCGRPNPAIFELDMHLYSGTAKRGQRARFMVKLALDIALAALMAVFLLPVFVIVAAVVGFDGGPVFYTHVRVGRGGRLFNCLKFRSMTLNGEKLLEDYLASDPAEATAWRVNRKLRNDPRVTRVGRFLRKTSLDELPQLFNVIRMEMSLVGPRPIVQQELILYGTSLPKYYHFRPGLTGLWQISGRSDTSFSDRVWFDTCYADSWSLWLDASILARTIPAVLLGAGAR